MTFFLKTETHICSVSCKDDVCDYKIWCDYDGDSIVCDSCEYRESCYIASPLSKEYFKLNSELNMVKEEYFKTIANISYLESQCVDSIYGISISSIVEEYEARRESLRDHGNELFHEINKIKKEVDINGC